MGVMAAHLAPTERLRQHQLIELYHAAVNPQAGAIKAKSAAWLAGRGYLHAWFPTSTEARYVITRKGWGALKRDWRLIADRVQGYPGVPV